MGILDVSRRGTWLAVGGLALLLGLCARASATLRQDASPSSAASDDDAYKRDPAWRASYARTGVIKLSREAGVNNFCLNSDGNVLVCLGGDREFYMPDPKTGRQTRKIIHSKPELRVFSPTGKVLRSIPVPIKPEAIVVDPSGAIYIGGSGAVCELDQRGNVVAKMTLPKTVAPRQPQTASEQTVTGIAVTPNDVFVASLSPSDYSYVVHRLTRALKHPKQIVSGLSGCCGQMDIQAYKGNLWVAHNARHRVEQYDRDGKKLSEFGREDRKAADAFGGCCEPKNLRFLNGFVYTAESGPPTVVKKFNLHGDFLGVVAIPDFQSGCVRVSVDVSKDNRQVFVLDSDGAEIHVFGRTSNVVRR